MSVSTPCGRHSSADTVLERSPYELTLQSRLEGLHPRLRDYFVAIPEGCVGRGTGVFDTVGTPRMWMWPVLRLLAREHVLFPVWAERVQFGIENRPITGDDGSVGVAGRRTFHFGAGDRVMIDAITAVPIAGGFDLVGLLGPGGRPRVMLEGSVVDGALHLRSRRVSIMLASRVLVIPRLIAPVVRLIERFDDQTERQHVSVTVCLPVLGRIYEYSGTFVYEITPDVGQPLLEDRG